MTPSLRKTAAALLLTLALSACTTAGARLPDPDSLYPIEMTTCADAPVVPERPAPDEPREEPAKAQYVVGLRASFVDCKDTVGDWAGRRDRYVDRWEKQNYNAAERLIRRATGKTGTSEQ